MKKVSQDNMMRYLWAESCENARLNDCFHKNTVRYSTLFIRMCVMVGIKLRTECTTFYERHFIGQDLEQFLSMTLLVDRIRMELCTMY